MIKNMTVLSAVGLLIGVALLYWMPPLTAAGAGALLVLATAATNVAGALILWLWKASRRTPHNHRARLLLIACLAAPSPAWAQSAFTTVCQFTAGPRAGTNFDFAPYGAQPIPVGSPCTDGLGSFGTAVPYFGHNNPSLTAAPPFPPPPTTAGNAFPGFGSILPSPAGPSDTSGTPLRADRAYLKAADIPPQHVGAYGIVAFTAMPTSSSRPRLLRVCQAFTASLPRQDTLPASVALEDQMITVWPLDNPTSVEASKDDCGYAVDHYDLYGGTSAVQDARSQGASLTGSGPFLLGWSPSLSRGKPGNLVLVVDLSSLDSQDSFDDAFQYWQTMVVVEPSRWRSGFAAEEIRLAFRDFLDRYGKSILSFAHKDGQ